MPANQSMDLHVHSCYSDGRLSPAELAARAVHNNVVALAICDHDTLEGAAEKEGACRAAGIVPVSGVELSCQLDGSEVHILSLFADPDSACAAMLDELRDARERRMSAMLEKLSRLGIRLELSDLPSEVGVLGRPHLARALMEKGYVKSISEAFGRYLYDEGPVHISKRRLTAAEGIDLAQRLGGAAILAHPGVSRLLGNLDELRALGLDGIEVHHPRHGGTAVASLLRYCRDHNLVVSGGSDFHAPGESPDIGSQRVPRDLLDDIREVAYSRRQTFCDRA